MAYINWDNSFSVSIPSIDKQHQELINSINEFYESFSSGTHKEKLVELVEALIDYTKKHFSTEEKYMTEFNFDGYENHKKEHDAFVGKVNDFYKKYREGKMLLSIEVTNFLKDWIIQHIKGTDKLYSKLLVENNIK